MPIWSHSHSADVLKKLRTATNHYHAAIIKAKRAYNSSLISSSISNPRQLWSNINRLLHRSPLPALPILVTLLVLCLNLLLNSSRTKFTNFTPVFYLITHLPLLIYLLLLLLLAFHPSFLSPVKKC